jgi:hypothetical protein
MRLMKTLMETKQMNLTEAKAAEQTATTQLADAQREVMEAEKRLTDARKDCEKAIANVRAADPDSGRFTEVISAKSLAEGRVMALEEKLTGARAALAKAKSNAEGSSVAAMQAELNDLQAAVAGIDSGLVEYIATAREEARSRLANLEQILRRANALDMEMSKRRGDPWEPWRWPRSYGTLSSCLTTSGDRNILQYLERAIDDERRG